MITKTDITFIVTYLMLSLLCLWRLDKAGKLDDIGWGWIIFYILCFSFWLSIGMELSEWLAQAVQ